MPCYTERTVTLNLEVANEDLLVQALEASGFAVTRVGVKNLTIQRQGQYGYIRGGTIEVNRSQQAWAGEIKQAYAQEAIKAAAKRFNWMVKQQDTSFTLQRRFA